MKQLGKIVLFAGCIASLFAVSGCDSMTNENPVSPDKMQEIRKQEGDQRANFHPEVGPPPSGNR